MWPQVWDQHAEQSDPQPPGSRWGQEFKFLFQTKSVCVPKCCDKIELLDEYLAPWDSMLATFARLLRARFKEW